MNLDNWFEPDPAIEFTLNNEQEWDAALARYRGSRNDAPFNRCVEIARTHGARRLVIETRFPDMDFRSEHHALYGRGFSDVPSYAHRLHFFAGDTGEDLTNLDPDAGYIGYVIVRPVDSGLVSRAMLPPPGGLANVQCAVDETIWLFGQQLTIRGVPFTQQDTRLGACAHAAAWVCHYTAVLRGEVARRPRADFALEADPRLGLGRLVPTKGLTVAQLGDLLRKFGLPAEIYLMGSLPTPGLPWQTEEPSAPVAGADPGTWDTRVFAVACRHLNSGYPILVGTYNHAFVLVGWSRDPEDPHRIIFLRHDDQRGPYLPVVSPLADEITHPYPHSYGPWRTLQVPLPPELWLAPESAERQAGFQLRGFSEFLRGELAKRGEEIRTLEDLIKEDKLALHTYARRSESFKAALPSLGIEPAFVAAYRLLRLPRHVWVVEAVDRELRSAGKPCVLGEAIIDATSADNAPSVIAARTHGALAVFGQVNRLTIGADRSPTRMGGALA